LSGAADIVVAGPPAFLTLWDRTRENFKVKGIASMTSIPMYLNTRSPHLKSLRDFGPTDKIAVTAVKVSIPAIILQMAAIKEFGRADYGAFDKYTVSLTHPDALAALMSGGGEINAHFTSPPFHQRERKSANIRTIMTSNDVMGGPSTFTMLYTTGKFHDENPKVYTAFLRALEQAIGLVNADKRAAGQTFIDMEARNMPLEEVLEVLNDPDIRYTTSPENLMKYADFMHGVGTLKKRPGTWQELFFPAIHGVPGG
jgi:NitT/TauT family transport system substrate-binding protein